MKYDVIVIGSGAGGATVSKDLSKKGYNVLVLEKGNKQNNGDYVNYIKTKYVNLDLDLSKEDKEKYNFLTKPVELSYVEEIGGTTLVSLGNACYSCDGCYSNSITAQFEKYNINILNDLLEAGLDLNVSIYPSNLWGNATEKIFKASKELGYEMEPMPKFIDFSKCINCGLCVTGCKNNARWDATYFINEAIDNGAEVISNFEVTKIIHEDGIVKKVEGIENGLKKSFEAKIVVLSAGALNTPIILRNSGIQKNVGEKIFFDMFTTIGGYLKDSNLNKELLMGTKLEYGPYFLTPHYSTQLVSLMDNKRYADVKPSDVMSLMLKFADDSTGKIRKDNSIKKELTTRDIDIIKEGYDKAVNILIKLGVKPDSIVATQLRGAHPGGTAALGEVVDNNFETEINGLYISDASIIPEAPGRPPILTITALSKRLVKIIDKRLKL
jgi:choline dehydrogenase-like flavoprotein